MRLEGCFGGRAASTRQRRGWGWGWEGWKGGWRPLPARRLRAGWPGGRREPGVFQHDYFTPAPPPPPPELSCRLVPWLECNPW